MSGSLRSSLSDISIRLSFLAQLLKDGETLDPAALELAAREVEQLLERTAIEVRDQLQKDPQLALLPSGRAVSMAGIMMTQALPNGPSEAFVVQYHTGANLQFIEASDVAALKEAVRKVGIAIMLPETEEVPT